MGLQTVSVLVAIRIAVNRLLADRVRPQRTLRVSLHYIDAENAILRWPGRSEAEERGWPDGLPRGELAVRT
jgi:hypothetical protein